MTLRHVMVPGLSTADLERGALRSLLDAATSRARLVSSFPATITVQETTLLTGVPPTLHGVLFADDQPRTPHLIDAWHHRLDTLVNGGNLDELEEQLRTARAEVDVLLVSGCPTGHAPKWIVDPRPATPEGFRLRFEDTFILCEAIDEGAVLPSTVVDEWLRTPGIERVLAPSPESSGAWMAPADRGWILVAEKGWAFRETSCAFGRIEADAHPVLFSLGSAWPVVWPGAVHDWRIAPTVLEAAGENADHCFDAPIPGGDLLDG